MACGKARRKSARNCQWNFELTEQLVTGNITIPESVTSIGDAAFLLCKNLTEVTIPDSVTNIGKSAFKYCENLTEITIPYGVISIEESVFYSCTSLTEITIPNSVTNIGPMPLTTVRN